MQTRLLLNLFLFITVLALAVTAWFVYQDKHAVNYLSSLPPAQVNRIVIPREHGDIILSATGDNWRMEKPYKLPAHNFRVQSLLGLLQTPVNQSYASSELDLSQLGLMPARASILFNDREIRFGKANPVNHKRYLFSEQRVYLLDDSLYPLVSAEAASLVSLSLLEPGMTIQTISLPDITLKKMPDKTWHDQHGKSVSADSAQQLLDNWRDASAYAVHAYMSRDKARAVKLELDNQTTIHFLVATDNNAVIIGHPEAGVEYHLDAQYADSLLNIPSN
ncbi:MAG TPA: DUF4340 domain-containing protein [Gammaproteobacteria bacterium]|nr:DUF4340 domain-containing protein [Gammaproteobacteria bacterium]